MPDTTIKKVEAGTSPRGEMGQKYRTKSAPMSNHGRAFSDLLATKLAD